MNEKELDEFIEWECNPDAREDEELFGVETWQKKALEILQNALKCKMLNDNVDWIRGHDYVTACPALCGEKWDEYAKDDETTALYHAIKKHAPPGCHHGHCGWISWCSSDTRAKKSN